MTMQSINIPLEERPSPTVELLNIMTVNGLEKLNIHLFLDYCPYTLEQLCRKNNVPEVVQWRHIGLVIRYSETLNTITAAAYFERHHSTLFHAIGAFKDALDGYYPEMLNKINTLATRSKMVIQEYPLIQKSEDNNQNLIASQIAMQNTLQITQKL